MNVKWVEIPSLAALQVTKYMTTYLVFKTLNGTLLDLMVTNKPKSFCKTCTIEAELSDCYKMIVTFLRASFKRIPLKNLFKNCL